jgi:antitoxin ParD1/3/4
MATVNVSLPQSVKDFVDARVAEGGYGSASEYVIALIERDRQRAEELKNLRAQVQDGADQLERGEYVPFDSKDQILEDIERRGRERLAKRNGK